MSYISRDSKGNPRPCLNLGIIQIWGKTDQDWKESPYPVIPLLIAVIVAVSFVIALGVTTHSGPWQQ